MGTARAVHAANALVIAALAAGAAMAVRPGAAQAQPAAGQPVPAGAQPAGGQPVPAVPLLLVDAPAGFDAARFATALETYVPNAQIVVTPHAAAELGMICADAQAAARAAASPVALWARWQFGTLMIERVGDGGCGAIESSAVDVPPDQAAFVYRVAALKVASLVRELPVAPPAIEPAISEPVVSQPIDERAVGERPSPLDDQPAGLVERRSARIVELGLSGIAGLDAADRIGLVSAGAWFGAGRRGRRGGATVRTDWAFGGTLMISAARDEEAAAGSGSARVFGGFGGVRRTLMARPGWQLDVTAELGVLHVRSTATRSGTTTDMGDSVWTPALALAPRIRIPLMGPLAIGAGPTLEASSRAVHLTLGDTPLYNASRLRLRADVRAELHF